MDAGGACGATAGRAAGAEAEEEAEAAAEAAAEEEELLLWAASEPICSRFRCCCPLRWREAV